MADAALGRIAMSKSIHMDAQAAAIRFNSWNDLFTFSKGLENWFYRGQACSEWKLQSSLERAIRLESGSTWRWQHTERWMLRKFRAFAHNYLAHPPAEDNLFEWLTLMQHHGAPTRLLDCTFSFAVAAFFASREGESDFAIWAFNWNHFRETATKRFALKLAPEFTALEFYAAVENKANEFLKETSSGALAFPVMPSRSNERLEIQQGMFLFPCDCARTLRENVECLVGKSGKNLWKALATTVPYKAVINPKALGNHWVLKLVLAKEERIKVLKDLQSMNVHEASLFPGLDGFARSLGRYTWWER
jgi:FRG domain